MEVPWSIHGDAMKARWSLDGKYLERKSMDAFMGTHKYCHPSFHRFEVNTLSISATLFSSLSPLFSWTAQHASLRSCQPSSLSL